MAFSLAQAREAVGVLQQTFNRWKRIDKIRSRLPDKYRRRLPRSRIHIVAGLIKALVRAGAIKARGMLGGFGCVGCGLGDLDQVEPYSLQREMCLMLDPEDDEIPEHCRPHFARAGIPTGVVYGGMPLDGPLGLAPITIGAGVLVLLAVGGTVSIVAIARAWPMIKREARMSKQAEAAALHLDRLAATEARQALEVGIERARELAHERATETAPFFAPPPEEAPEEAPGEGFQLPEVLTGTTGKVAIPLLLGSAVLAWLLLRDQRRR